MNVGDLETYERDHMHFNIRKFHEKVTDKTVIKNTTKVTQKDLIENREVNYKSHETIYGKIGLMCPHCYNYIIRNVNINCSISIENEEPTQKTDPELWVANDFRYMLRKCPICGEWDVDMIPVDVNIVECVSILNRKGFKTKFCCEGHGEKSTNAYIMFEDNSIIQFFNTLPITWYHDYDSLKNFGSICIRSESSDYVEGMLDIKEWAYSLPWNFPLKKISFDLVEKDIVTKNKRVIPSDKVVQELKEYAKQQTSLPLLLDAPSEILKQDLELMKGFNIGESYIQQPSHAISFHTIKEPSTDVIDKILVNLKNRPNSAIYGLLKSFGGYDGDNNQ